MLSDESKRKEYDAWGSTSEQMGMGSQQTNRNARDFNWQFKSSVNAEELFRKIFGDAGFNSSTFTDFEDLADSRYGFGASQEVDVLDKFSCFKDIILILLCLENVWKISVFYNSWVC